jgi:hypothetical protein
VHGENSNQLEEDVRKLLCSHSTYFFITWKIFRLAMAVALSTISAFSSEEFFPSHFLRLPPGREIYPPSSSEFLSSSSSSSLAPGFKYRGPLRRFARRLVLVLDPPGAPKNPLLVAPPDAPPPMLVLLIEPPRPVSPPPVSFPKPKPRVVWVMLGAPRTQLL